MKESDHQIHLFKWAKLLLPDEEELMYHIPNGGSRNAREGYHLKLQGVKSGVPDINLAIPNARYHGLFVELKNEYGKPSPNQLRWIAKLNERGYLAKVCSGWEEAADLITDYLR